MNRSELDEICLFANSNVRSSFTFDHGEADEARFMYIQDDAVQHLADRDCAQPRLDSSKCGSISWRCVVGSIDERFGHQSLIRICLRRSNMC